LQDRFSRPGRLADQHYIAQHRATRDRRRLHAWATPALHELGDMIVEASLNARAGDHFVK
jgi:hypothetical protein